MPAKGPDPAEFDAEFVVGDDDSSTRTSTPVQMPETGGDGNAGNAADQESGREKSKEKGVDSARPSNAIPEESAQMELPTEVRVRLRRLDKLEGRYQGWCGLL